MRRKLMWVFIFIMLVLLLFLFIRVMEQHIFPKSQVSTQYGKSQNIEITRNKYYLRNFIWSGIFPIYGGFIADPHFLYKLPVDVTEYLIPVFHGKPIRYQLIQVNPFFENKTSETILAMEIDGEAFEYRLEVPHDFSYFSTKTEPPSEFLYDGDNLYFILVHGYDNEFLVYEIIAPFNEDKSLSKHLVTVDNGNVPNFMEFSLTKDQINRLVHHHNRRLYDFYTQILNKNYTIEQLSKFNNEKGKTILLTTLYGTGLNLQPKLTNELAKQNDNLYGLQLKSDYEFITSTQLVDFVYVPTDNKILIKVDHLNYDDVISRENHLKHLHMPLNKRLSILLLKRIILKE